MLGYDYLPIPLDNNLLYTWAKESYKEFQQGTASGKISKKRNSKVSFLTPNEKIRKELFRLANNANELGGWELKITNVENLQYTVYEKGDYYNWHTDVGKKRNPLGIRKLSFTMILNDNYEGGTLQMEHGAPNSDDRIYNISPKLGEIIWFPSYKWHRVTLVTSGVRHSLVCWFIGDYG